MLFSKIFKKIYKPLIVICILLLAYLNIKNLIKNKLSPTELVIFSQNIKDVSENIKNSSDLISTAIKKPSLLFNLKSLFSNNIENSIIIRTDKNMNFNNLNWIFCEDEISFSIKSNEGKVENFEKVKYGSFSLIQDKFPNVDYALQFAEMEKEADFVSIIKSKKDSTDKKPFKYSVKLNEYLNQQSDIPYFFYNNPRNFSNKRGSCDSMFISSIRLMSFDKNEIMAEKKIEFNLGKNFFPRNIEKIILTSFQGDEIIFPVSTKDLKDKKISETIDKNIINIKEILFLEVKIIDIL